MRLITADGAAVSPGDTLIHVGTARGWTYVRPGVPPDPTRSPPFVGRVIMSDGDHEVEFYPQEFRLNYAE